MKNRWYELTPSVCIILSKIEMAQEYDRNRYGKQILLELANAGYKPDREIYMKRISGYEMKRWYDNNRILFRAFEYLKDANQDIQKIVSIKILDYMHSEKCA